MRRLYLGSAPGSRGKRGGTGAMKDGLEYEIPWAEYNMEMSKIFVNCHFSVHWRPWGAKKWLLLKMTRWEKQRIAKGKNLSVWSFSPWHCDVFSLYFLSPLAHATIQTKSDKIASGPAFAGGWWLTGASLRYLPRIETCQEIESSLKEDCIKLSNRGNQVTYGRFFSSLLFCLV